MDKIVEADKRFNCLSRSRLTEGVRSDETKIVASFV
jgi:hypothetical protein